MSSSPSHSSDDRPSQKAGDNLELTGPPCNPSNLPLLEFHVLALITGFCMTGAIIRIALTALFTVPSGQSVFPVVWPQAVGCFIFGLVSERREEVIAHWPELYIGLRVGLAGSVATFATWQLQSFLSFSDFDNRQRAWVKDAADGLSQILVTFAVAWISLQFGRHIHTHLPRLIPPKEHASSSSALLPAHSPKRPAPSHPRIKNVIAIFALSLYLVPLLLFILTPHTPSSPKAGTDAYRNTRRLALTLMLAPPGAILRWWAAAVFNPRSPQWIKWGTWGVNMVSTALLGVAYLLQRRNQGPGGVGVSVIGCGALQAIQDGFCGCLSTIPSFLEHAETMHKGKRWWYSWTYVALCQYLCGLLMIILTLGVGWWTYGEHLPSACVY